jgi:hypothetical protein
VVDRGEWTHGAQADGEVGGGRYRVVVAAKVAVSGQSVLVCGGPARTRELV